MVSDPGDALFQCISPFLNDNNGIADAHVQTIVFFIDKMQNVSQMDTMILIIKVLQSTSNQIIDKLLDAGAWEILSEWIAIARDSRLHEWMERILTLYLGLPVNVERLRKTDCAREIRRLVRSHPNSVVSTLSGQIVAKWKNIVFFDNHDGSEGSDSASGRVKKRKESEHAGSNNDRVKSRKSSPKKSAENGSQSQPTSSASTSASTGVVPPTRKPALVSSSSKDKPSKPESVFRSVTAKVKQSKSRQDFLVESTSEAYSNKTAKASKPKVTELKTSEGIKIKLIPPQPQKPVQGARVGDNTIRPLGNSKFPGDSLKFPTSTNSTGAIASKPVIPAPLSFLDAISAPTMPKIKKKIPRKESESAAAATSGAAQSKEMEFKGAKDSEVGKTGSRTSDLKTEDDPKSSVSKMNSDVNKVDEPKFNFYVDLLDQPKEKPDGNKTKGATLAQSSTASTVSSDCPVSPADPLDKCASNGAANVPTSIPIGGPHRGILLFGRSRHKFPLRFAPNEKLCQIKYFECDWTERTNVSRNVEMKRSDMKKEAEQMQEARRQSENSKRFRAIELDLSGATTFTHLAGRDSVEKIVQAERNQSSLEVFYMSHQIPDSPASPDPTPSEPYKSPIIIPWDDNIPPIEVLPLHSDPISSAPNFQAAPIAPVNYIPPPFNAAPGYKDMYGPYSNSYAPGPASSIVPPGPADNRFNHNAYKGPGPFNSEFGSQMPNRPESSNFNSNPTSNFNYQASPPRDSYNGSTAYWPDNFGNGGVGAAAAYNNNNNFGPPPSGQLSGPPRFSGRGGRGGRGRGGGFQHNAGDHGGVDHPSNRKPICKFYARYGNCRYKEKCNYIHDVPPAQPPF